MAEKSFSAVADIQGLAATLKLNIIGEARRKLDEYFDPKTTRYVLSETYDPESGSRGLMLEVHTDLGVKEAMAALEKFDDEYWLDVMPADTSVVVDVFPT